MKIFGQGEGRGQKSCLFANILHEWPLICLRIVDKNLKSNNLRNVYFNQNILNGTERTHKSLISMKKSHQLIRFLKIYDQNN